MAATLASGGSPPSPGAMIACALAVEGYGTVLTICEPCSYGGSGPDGYHLARFAQARHRGLISEPDMTVDLATAGAVFTPASLVREGTP